MGVSYVVIPLLPDNKDEMRAWLRSLDITCPGGDGRYPSIQKLHSVLDHLEGYAVHDSAGPGHWYADVSQADRATSDWAFRAVNDHSGNEAEFLGFGFERGSPRVMLLILQRLASMCGPLMLVPDTGELPIVVTPDLDLDQALREWGV